MTKMIFGEEGFQYIQYREKEFCIDSSLCSIMFLIYVQYHLIIWGSDKKDKRRKTWTCSPFSKCVAAPPLAVTFYVSSIWLLDFGTSNFQHIEIKGFSVFIYLFYFAQFHHKQSVFLSKGGNTQFHFSYIQ